MLNEKQNLTVNKTSIAAVDEHKNTDWTCTIKNTILFTRSEKILQITFQTSYSRVLESKGIVNSSNTERRSQNTATR